ncbi:transposase [Patescibacteria group bacterium]
MKKEGPWVVNGKWLGKYRRESIRLPGWDYSWDGFYFVIICVENHEKLLGKIVDMEVKLSKIGQIVQKYWQEIPKHFDNIWLDAFKVMPSHVHGTIVIDNSVGYLLNNGRGVAMQRLHHTAIQRRHRYDNDYQKPDHQPNKNSNYYSQISPKPNSLSAIIRSFKSICTREINKLYPDLKFKWQSKYYDSIVWNEWGIENVRWYINNNVLVHELRKIDKNDHAKIKATIKKFETKRTIKKPHLL